MTEINATLVMTLRESTGAGVIDCKKALMETHGDLQAAVDRLRAAEIAKAASKAHRATAEGLVALVVEGTRGAIVDVRRRSSRRWSRAACGSSTRKSCSARSLSC